MTQTALVLICIFSLSTLYLVIADQQGAGGRLAQDLLTSYNPVVRPSKNQSQATIVTVNLRISQIQEIDERHQLLSAFVWWGMYWRDDYLGWNASDYDGMSNIVFPPGKIWLPDTIISNSAERLFDDQRETFFRPRIESSGDINWWHGGKVTCTCIMDITYFPFDRQSCQLVVINWAYNGFEVDLMPHPLNLKSDVKTRIYIENSHWTLIDITVKRSVFYLGGVIPAPQLTYTVNLDRKPAYQIFNIVIPCIMISILALFMFCLPAASGEKVSLGITVLMSLSVFLIMINDNLPKTSDYTSILGIYITCIMVNTALSTIATILVLNLYHHDAGARVPKYLRFFVFSILSKVVFYNSKYPEASRSRKIKPQENRFSSELSISTVVESKDNEKPVIKHDIFEDIYLQLKRISSKLESKEKDEANRAEWEEVSKILDRFFLLLFFLAIVIATFATLVIFPFAGRY